MALDEVLLTTLSAPVVRVYEWQPHTITLGYAQRAADVDRAACERWGLDVTRRLTGGRAVLHADELTYSVIAPPDLVGGLRNLTRSYQLISGCLATALRAAGLAIEFSERPTAPAARLGAHDPACFAASLGGDLVVSGRKLVGSAQLQRLGGVLQHGSLPRTLDHRPLDECLRRPAGAQHNWTSLSDLGVGLSPLRFAQLMGEAYAELFGALTEPQEPTADEWAAARALAAEKYATDAWIERL